MSNMEMIVAQIAQSSIDAEAPLKDMLKQALKGAIENGLTTDENTNYRGALAAVLVALVKNDRHEDKEKLEKELEAIKSMNALLSGVPVDISTMMERAGGEDFEAIGIMKLWDEVKKEN